MPEWFLPWSRQQEGWVPPSDADRHVIYVINGEEELSLDCSCGLMLEVGSVATLDWVNELAAEHRAAAIDVKTQHAITELQTRAEALAQEDPELAAAINAVSASTDPAASWRRIYACGQLVEQMRARTP
jgi:hypothetical protein